MRASARASMPSRSKRNHQAPEFEPQGAEQTRQEKAVESSYVKSLTRKKKNYYLWSSARIVCAFKLVVGSLELGARVLG